MMRFSTFLMAIAVSTSLSAQPLQELRVLRAEAPTYPPLARQAMIQGDVRVRLQIGSDGKVSETKAITGNPLLKQEAEKTALRWVFAPPTREMDVPIIQELLFEFRIEGEASYHPETRVLWEMPATVRVITTPPPGHIQYAKLLQDPTSFAKKVGEPTLPRQIALHEAEVLIYLLPFAQVSRAEGSEIEWMMDVSGGLNQEDYYMFYVHDSQRDTDSAASMGYFAVNKHTADVWDRVTGEQVRSRKIAKVQELLRRAHGISQEIVEKYRSRPLGIEQVTHTPH